MNIRLITTKPTVITILKIHSIDYLFGLAFGSSRKFTLSNQQHFLNTVRLEVTAICKPSFSSFILG